jgi:hypothetical protein
VVDEGCSKAKIKIGFEIEVRVWATAHTLSLVFDFGVRCAHTACGLDVDLFSPVHRLDLSLISGAVRRGLSEYVAA